MTKIVKKLVAGVSMLAMLATVAIVAPPAALGADEIEAECYRFSWVGEDSAFGLDEQLFSAEIDGSVVTKVSAPDADTLRANEIWDYVWLPTGDVAFVDLDSPGAWITNAFGYDERPLQRLDNSTPFMGRSPNGDYVTVSGEIQIGADEYAVNHQIFRVSDSSTIFYNVTHGLSWSADSSRIVWSDGTDVVTSNPDGSGVQTVLEDTVGRFSFSPSQTQLLGIVDNEVVLVNVDGTNRMTLGTVERFGRSQWSADGSRIAWEAGGSVFIVDSTGAPVATLAGTDPSWSPDGTLLSFVDAASLIVTNADGVGRTEVGPADSSSGVWSPDSTHISWDVYTGDRADAWIGPVDGSGARLMGSDDSGESGIWRAFSPDSAYIGWVSFDQVQIETLDGSAVEDIGASFPYPPIVNFGAGFSPCVFEPGASNDDFVDAVDLVEASDAIHYGFTVTLRSSTKHESVEVGEPRHGFSRPQATLWWKWTPDEDVLAQIDTVGSGFDTTLAVYTGDQLDDLDLVVQNKRSARGDGSRVRFFAEAGETYRIATGGFGSNSRGQLRLNVGAPRQDDLECTITGTDAAETLIGTSGRDVICGLGGDDIIRGLGGSDIIFAGEGNDRVEAGGGSDVVVSGDGDDRIFGGSGDDFVDAGDGADRVFGSTGNDVLFAGEGNDKLFGADGEDRLYGGNGNDRLSGGNDVDYLDGGSGKQNDCFPGASTGDILIDCDNV